jgi:hypothetical protein
LISNWDEAISFCASTQVLSKKDAESAPLYHRFGGDRINDYHLKLDDKRASRKMKENDAKGIELGETNE